MSVIYYVLNMISNTADGVSIVVANMIFVACMFLVIRLN